MGTHPTLDEIERIFNEGRFREALEMSHQVASGRNAAYWSQRAMILLHLNEIEDASNCLKDARRSRGWHNQLEMAFKRDLALAVIRRTQKDVQLRPVLYTLGYEGDPDDLERVVHYLLEPMLVMGDENDDAYRRTILGRFYSSWRHPASEKHEHGDNIDIALRHFKKADAIWSELGASANRQWQMNNRYHWFKALRWQHSLPGLMRDKSSKALDLYSLVQQDDPNKRRRKMAKLILFTGRFGLWVERRIS